MKFVMIFFLKCQNRWLDNGQQEFEYIKTILSSKDRHRYASFISTALTFFKKMGFFSKIQSDFLKRIANG